MMELKDKIIEHFEGRVVRKDLTKLVKGNCVPTYVLGICRATLCISDD